MSLKVRNTFTLVLHSSHLASYEPLAHDQALRLGEQDERAIEGEARGRTGLDSQGKVHAAPEHELEVRRASSLNHYLLTHAQAIGSRS